MSQTLNNGNNMSLEENIYKALNELNILDKLYIKDKPYDFYITVFLHDNTTYCFFY